MKEEKIACLYKQFNKVNQSSVIIINQTEEAKSIIIFSNSVVCPLIGEPGDIYDSTVLSSYLQI